MLKRWKTSEPVRLYLYGLLAPVLGLAIVYGVLDAEQAAAWSLLGGAVLVPAVELARAKVTPAEAEGRRRR